MLRKGRTLDSEMDEQKKGTGENNNFLNLSVLGLGSFEQDKTIFNN